MLSKKFDKLLNSSLILKFNKNVHYNDEPFLYQYTTFAGKNIHNGQFGGGMSFDKDQAKQKALGEAIERYCLSVYDRNNMLRASIKKLTGLSFLDLSTITGILNKKFSYKITDRFWWAKGISLPSYQEVLLPAQLIYVPYSFQKEPILRLPISTGAALGDSLKSAIIKGICEVVERDSFMIFYLNKIIPPVVDVTGIDKKLKKIINLLERYKLETTVFDITSDIGLPVAMTLIIDKTGIGPFISIGAKCSVDFQDTILGSIEEALHSRPWMRSEMKIVKKVDLESIKNNSVKISTPKDRGLYWYDGVKKNYLSFWLNNTGKHKIIKRQKTFRNLEQIVHRLSSMGYSVFYVDLTTPEVTQLGFKAVKVIIPELQPLYLIEEYPYWEGERLKNVPVKLGYKGNREYLTEIPHPFL